MFSEIPGDAIKFIRAAFATANQRVTSLLARHPSAHEEMLDFQLIASLNEVGPSLMPISGSTVEIQTHWLGGRRHFGAWEIADIALVIMLRRGGRLVARKVALLQSKRLYSREIPVAELEAIDYRIGIGRLIDRPEPIVSSTTPRIFRFSKDSVYCALEANSDQVGRIEQYMHDRRLPVYYSLYNPPTIPYQGKVPADILAKKQKPNELGCRVLTADEVHRVLSDMPSGRSPTFSLLVSPNRKSSTDRYFNHGWRLEAFVADEVLRCRQGRLFETAQDEDLESLLYRRSAPIAAAIAVTIDLPGERRQRTRKS